MTNSTCHRAPRDSSSTAATAARTGCATPCACSGTGRFHRLRIGIGHPGHKDKVTPWVLGKPGRDDEAAILRSIEDAIDVLPLAVAGDFNEAMKRLHTPQA